MPNRYTVLRTWKARTEYLSDDVVLSPTNEVVSANAYHVSGDTYDASLWTSTLSNSLRSATAVTSKTLVIGPVRQYYPAGGPTSFPGQLRPYEPTRRFAIIRNHAPVTVMQIGIQTNPANSYNAPGSYPYSIPPGGSLVLANQTGAILARAQTAGQVWHCSTEAHLAVI